MLSIPQERALAIVPKIMSSCSIPCSCFIIYEVFCDHRTRGTTPVQRALVGMSLVDISASFAWFLSTWAVPEGSFAFSAGNRVSCNFQGFLLQLAIGAPLYNSSLALFYLLIIKQRWTDQELVRIERWVHGFILSFTIGTSILLLQLEQYNHIGAVCWVIGEPAGCGNSSYQASDVPCDRGDHAYLYGLALFYGPLWVCVIACCTSMAILWLEVRKVHRRSRRHSVAIGMQHSLSRSGSDSSRVAFQAILYSLSFLVTWMPSTLWSIAHWFNWSAFGLDMAAATAEPLQGFWNCLIFLKSRPKSVLKIRRVLAYILPCVFTPPSDFDPTRSFASGLRHTVSASRITKSDIDPFHSSDPNFTSDQQMDETNPQDPKKKLAQRGTASTEALDELKSSIQDLDGDITGNGNKNKHVEFSGDSDQFVDESGEAENNVPQPAYTVNEASEDTIDDVVETKPNHVGDETDIHVPQPAHPVEETSEDTDDHVFENKPDTMPLSSDELGAEYSEMIDGPLESTILSATKNDFLENQEVSDSFVEGQTNDSHNTPETASELKAEPHDRRDISSSALSEDVNHHEKLENHSSSVSEQGPIRCASNDTPESALDGSQQDDAGFMGAVEGETFGGAGHGHDEALQASLS